MTPTAQDTTALTAQQRTTLRDRLAADRAATDLLVAQMISDLDSFTLSRNDTSTDDEHDPEGPTLAFERSQSAAILEQSREHLAQIDSAIERIDEGSFGVCVSCGASIPFARLEVRPYSTQCVPCAAKVRR